LRAAAVEGRERRRQSLSQPCSRPTLSAGQGGKGRGEEEAVVVWIMLLLLVAVSSPVAAGWIWMEVGWVEKELI